MGLKLKRMIVFIISILFLLLGVILIITALYGQDDFWVVDMLFKIVRTVDIYKVKAVCSCVGILSFVITVTLWFICLWMTWRSYKDFDVQEANDKRSKIIGNIDDSDEQISINYKAHKKDNS